ncbi:3D domain-containing protein [Ralstonia holmesii]|uniref:3D domain-containing protein n=1 Tax=Ralstonia holmesii TaxID=3058602 RepID=UPI003F149570
MSFLRFVAVACAVLPLAASAASEQADFDLPSQSRNAGQSLQLWATHYFVHSAASAPSGLPFRDRSGKSLSENVSPRDWCLGAIEGTIQVPAKDGLRTLNYSGIGHSSQINCASVLKIDPIKKPWILGVGRSYFASAKGAYGDGVQDYRLVPYRTIAVDKNTIPFGTVLFVRQAKGAEIHLPSGDTIKHDGYFFAGDTGGAIKGKHVDVFCGNSPTNCFPDFISSDESKTFDAVVVTEPDIVAKLRALHKQ